MQKNKLIIFSICLFIILLNLFLIYKNPYCPFHVDYVQYTKSINTFYDKHIIDDNVNGKYVYVYLMAILLMPFHLIKLSIFDSLVFVTGIFQAVLLYLFYKYTNSLFKTILAATTLTFLTYIGQAETVILASIFLMLYFIFKDKPYSEFFITIASFIRLDFAVYYLFAIRKNTIYIPMAITFLQWLTYRYFLQSDFGFNKNILETLIIFLLSYGIYFLLFIFFAKMKDKYECGIHAGIVIFFITFLNFASQKVFFFPILLSFMLYDFDFTHYKKHFKYIKYIICIFVAINLLSAFATIHRRSNLCSANAFIDYGAKHNESIYFGVFESYFTYHNLPLNPPYKYQITQNCSNTTDYFIAEDWRNSQLLYMPYKFCTEKWNNRYDLMPTNQTSTI